MSRLRNFVALTARTDLEAFVQFVGRDGKTGRPLVLAPMHRGMLRLWRDHQCSVTIAHPDAGKSTLKDLWEVDLLGKHPQKTIVIAGATAGMVERRIASLQRIIENSAELRLVYPNLKPGPIWTQSAFSVAARPPNLAGPNVIGASPEASGFLGVRADVIDIDDLCSRENSRTPEANDAMWSWYLSMLKSRTTPDAVTHATGMQWNADDVMHRLARQPGWVERRFPLLDADGNPSWPAKWTPELIARLRTELEQDSFTAFRRVYLLEDIPEGGVCFSTTALRQAALRGIRNSNFSSIPMGRIVIGCDPAFSVSSSSDLSALVAVCDLDGHRTVLECQAGRWSFDEIIGRAITMAQFYKGTIAIESNSGGKFLFAALKKKWATYEYHTSKESKAQRVDWFGAELQSDRWTFRARDGQLPAETRQLLYELSIYSLDQHAGDRASALLVALHHIRERAPRRASFYDATNQPQRTWSLKNLWSR